MQATQETLGVERKTQGGSCQALLGNSDKTSHPCGRYATYVVDGEARCQFHIPVLSTIDIINTLSALDRRVAKLEGG